MKELGRRLTICREQARLEVGQLALRSGVAVDRVVAFERGEGGLRMSDVVSVARALGVPRGSFLHSSAPVPRAYQAPDVMLLGRGTVSLRDEDREALAAGLVRARSFLEALDLTESPALRGEERLFQTAELTSEEPHVLGYARAREVRTRLSEFLPARAPLAGPLRDLARLIEDHFGILVALLTFASQDVAEASCRLGPARLIAVDARQPETTCRWALAHGLAHQLLDLEEEDAVHEEIDERFSLDKPQREKRADAFAAMLLAPQEAVEAVLGGRPLRELAEARGAVEDCRRALGLGFIPMTRQLQNLRRLSRETADALVATAQTAGVDGFEAPRRYDGLERRVLEALTGGWISRGRARELLGLSAGEDAWLDDALRS